MSAEDFKMMCEDLRDGLRQSKEKNDYGVEYRKTVQSIIDCNIKWDSLCWPLLKSFGATVVDENGEVTFDSDETLAAIEYWKSFTDDSEYNISLAVSITSGSTNPGNQFRMQQAPIYFQSRAVMSDVMTETSLAGQTYYAIKNLGVCSLPYFGDTYTVGGGCSGYAMYSQTVNKIAAWQFLKHIASIEGQNAYSATGDCVPVLTSLLNDTDAVWRNCLKDVLPSDFNHSAFIENTEAYASTRDFYQYIPFAAQAPVLASIEETFNECSSKQITTALIKNVIQSKANDMRAKIQQAK
jgi:ABC-type glycerol-3-phosphate transport system substrate-binding protein